MSFGNVAWRNVLQACVVLVALTAVPAKAQVEATFSKGGIAGYSGPNANKNSGVKSFDQLRITKIVMSQGGSSWGGTQGNDLSVTLTIYYLNELNNEVASTPFAGVLNWQQNSIGGGVDFFGVTTSSVISNTVDRYSLTGSNTSKTYILVLPSKIATSGFDALVTADNTDGSANFSSATIFQALQVDFPADVAPAANTSPTFTGTNATGTGGAASYSFDYPENKLSGATIATVSASDPEEDSLTFSIVGGDDNVWFAINPTTGAISLTEAGAVSLANDFEQLDNTRTLIVQVSDGANTTTIEVKLNETNVADTANTSPSFTGTNATGTGGAASYSFDYPENKLSGATIATVSASDPEKDALTFSIVGGNDDLWFAIDQTTGAISLTEAGAASLANDFEQLDNTRTLIVQVSDGANTTTIEVKLNETDVADTEIAITGPSGEAGAANSETIVPENQTAVTKLISSTPVTWTITGGSDQDNFEIAEDGTITFVAPPEFSNPTDGDGNNTYFLTVTATAPDGSISTQTLKVTVREIPPLLITGPTGGAGAAASSITINEGLTAVTTFTASETATWAIDGGTDAAKLKIDPETGAVSFLVAPNFESPTDSDSNNTYVVIIKATAGDKVSFQTLTITILNVDEIGRKLSEIGDKLRTGLRSYAMHGLSDMLSFNEALMRAANDDDCDGAAAARKPVSGSINATETSANTDLKYANRLTECGRRHQIFADAGLSMSRANGQWTTRVFAALRAETRIDKDLTVGLGVIGSTADDNISGFVGSSIKDKSLQANVYARYRIADGLRTGAFAGLGRTWYDFALNESDGFLLNGDMTGDRHLYGMMLSGDLRVAGTVLTTDAIVSRAVEKLGNAALDIRYLGEERTDMAFAVGTVDVTRISVPISAPFQLTGGSGAEEANDGLSTRLLLSPGLLCEDNSIDTSSLRCGYQLGARFTGTKGVRSRFYVDYHWESVAGLRRSLVGMGYAYRFGRKNGLELAFEVNRGVGGTTIINRDNRAMLNLRVAR